MCFDIVRNSIDKAQETFGISNPLPKPTQTGTVQEDQNGSILGSIWSDVTGTFKDVGQVVADTWIGKKYAELIEWQQKFVNEQDKAYAGQTPATQAAATGSTKLSNEAMIGIGLLGFAMLLLVIKR